MTGMPDRSVDLVMTSPPFSLLRTKDYGNVDSDGYSEWVQALRGRDPAHPEEQRKLRDRHRERVEPRAPDAQPLPVQVMLCDELGFHLAQDFYWWNPAKIPSPAEWVTIRRVRVKDAVNTVWWLSKTAWPKASNRRVLQPYSVRMRKLLANGAPTSTERPSGHDIDGKFKNDNQGLFPRIFWRSPTPTATADTCGTAGRRAGSRILRDSPGRCPSTSSGSSPTAETM